MSKPGTLEPAALRGQQVKYHETFLRMHGHTVILGTHDDDRACFIFDYNGGRGRPNPCYVVVHPAQGVIDSGTVSYSSTGWRHWQATKGEA